ncbi:MAG: replicative DNA helicase [Gammaproteobacteria bacterium]
MSDTAYSSVDSDDSEVRSMRIPPHSIEAERAVLGSVLIDADAWIKVVEIVQADDFYRHDHRLVFNAIAELDHAGKPFDVVTLAEWLESHRQLDEVGGLSFLADLAETTPSAGNVGSYADIVRKRSVLRQLITVTTGITETVFNPGGMSSDEVLDTAEKSVFEIAEQSSRGRRVYTSIKDLLTGALERVDELYQSKNPVTGVATGFEDLDEKTGGLQKGDLIIVAGRPSMGKTAFAINIAEHAVIKDKKSVAVFSMEMSGEQLAIRMMSSLGHVDQKKVRTGELENNDWPRLTSAVGMLQDARLFIDDTPALAPGELRARCRRIYREHELDMIVVDYLQLMQVPGTSENRATEISEISRSLKAMAKELNVPVIALSQLNRSLEQRPNKRPVMSDLRESGAIEQDADVILFIYRDEVYNEESPDKGMAEIIIGKQRNGPIGMIRLSFLGQYTRFESYIPEQPYMMSTDG